MNMPLAGLSLILSILIILAVQTWRGLHWLVGASAVAVPARIHAHKSNPILSIFIVAGIALLSLLQFSYIIERSLTPHDRFPASVFVAQPKDCVPLESSINSERSVILRLDDVQAFAWSDISMSMIEEGLEREFPTVAVTIPVGLSADSELIRYLQENECNLEIALHGWDNLPVVLNNVAYGEFAFLAYDEASERLNDGLVELSAITKTPVITFVPPQNQLSDNATRAVRDAGMPIISSEGEGFFDYDAATWDFVTQEFISSDTIIQTCEAQFATGNALCIIMLHPQDFAHDNGTRNAERFAEYIVLLDYLVEEDISVTTFREYSQ